MYGRIFGFQRLARCPKWTPASIKSLTCTMATHCPPIPCRGFNGCRDGKRGKLAPPAPCVGRHPAHPEYQGARVKKVIVARGRTTVKGFRAKTCARGQDPLC